MVKTYESRVPTSQSNNYSKAWRARDSNVLLPCCVQDIKVVEPQIMCLFGYECIILGTQFQSEDLFNSAHKQKNSKLLAGFSKIKPVPLLAQVDHRI